MRGLYVLPFTILSIHIDLQDGDQDSPLADLMESFVVLEGDEKLKVEISFWSSNDIHLKFILFAREINDHRKYICYAFSHHLPPDLKMQCKIYCKALLFNEMIYIRTVINLISPIGNTNQTLGEHGPLNIYQRWDQVPRRSKHPLLTGHTRCESYSRLDKRPKIYIYKEPISLLTSSTSLYDNSPP
jgi:hypothetical protein